MASTVEAERRRLDFWRDLFHPTPKQAEACRESLLHRYLLFGGSRYPGKSYWLRWGMAWRLPRWAKRGIRNVRVAIFSRDYPTLEDRQITKIRAEFPPWMGEVKDTQTDGLGFYMAPYLGGGMISLRNLDDPSKFIGGEWAGIGIEELTEIPIETVNSLRGSLRWPGIEDTFLWGVTNPYGPHLLWVRSLWLEHDFTEYPYLAALASQFQFVQGLPTDNPHLTESYWLDLVSQPEYLQRAWLHGDWYVIAGGMYEELRTATHQVPEEPPSEYTEKQISMDWGWSHNAAAVWTETDAGIDRPARTVVYREHRKNQTIPQIFAQEVVDLTAHKNEANLKRVVLDSAAWATPQDGGPSPAEQMLPVFRAASMTLEPANKGPRSRQHQWTLLHTYFHARKQLGPLLLISKACKKLWNELTTMVRRETDIEDVENHDQYDLAAALRYFVGSRPQPAKLTAEDIAVADPDRAKLIDLASYGAAKDERRRAAALELFRKIGFPAIRVPPAPLHKPRQLRRPWDR